MSIFPLSDIYDQYCVRLETTAFTFNWHRFVVTVVVSKSLGVACAWELQSDLGVECIMKMLTKIMNAPFVGIQAARLVSVEPFKKIFSEEGIGV